MVAIALRFLGGRYHATPWGRHVNEAEVEWPPSPWRVLRALLAAWHLKADHDLHPRPLLDRLVERLAEKLPVYDLPPAIRAHSRHYMPQGTLKKGREETSLVFDAFMRVTPEAELIVGWPDVELTQDESDLLRSLVESMGYVGRAESWVDARVVDHWNGSANCRASKESVDVESGEVFESVKLSAPTPPSEYAQWRSEAITEYGLAKKKLNAKEKRLRATLPELLVDAMELETSAVLRAGWSRAPGMQSVTYQRPCDALAPLPAMRHPVRLRAAPTTARLALSGSPLPRIEDAVRIGELVRLAALRCAEGLGERVPPVLSGKELLRADQHGHAFYLPEANADGRIDHVIVHAPSGLDQVALRSLDAISHIWHEKGGEWKVLFEQAGDPAHFAAVTDRFGPGRVWESVTPYLHPWHLKKSLGIEDQVRRECRMRGLPEPEVESLPTILVKGRHRRPVHFQRFRRKRGLTQPDSKGSFWRFCFPTAIEGPLALGFGCHFGLGCFRLLED